MCEKCETLKTNSILVSAIIMIMMKESRSLTIFSKVDIVHGTIFLSATGAVSLGLDLNDYLHTAEIMYLEAAKFKREMGIEKHAEGQEARKDN